MVFGHRVVVEAELEHSDEGGLRGPIEDGHRSVAYRFVGLGDEADQTFGGIVEEVLQGGEPGSRLVARVRFYHDLAEVYATVGAEFEVWYGRVVGHGRVLSVVEVGCESEL